MNDFLKSAFESILSPRERAADFEGQVLGSYRLQEKLKGGEGGFSVVYRAVHIDPDRTPHDVAAIKVLAFDIRQSPGLEKVFRDETTILKRISNSPGIERVVRINDWGIHEGLPWITLQYIEGQSLERWAQAAGEGKKRIPSVLIMRILSDVLEALQSIQDAYTGEPIAGRMRGAANAKALFVHRDIKPGNIIVCEEASGPRAWLIDFGVSKIFPAERSSAAPVTSEGVQTQAASAMTLPYASPEMLVNRPSEDARSDLFQVGLLGFELLTGHRYWDVWRDADRHLRQCNHPRQLRWAIRQALRWDRDRRHQNAREFLDALQRPIQSLLNWRSLRRHWRRSISVACVSLLLIGFLGTLMHGASVSEQNQKLHSDLGAALSDAAQLRKDNNDLRPTSINTAEETAQITNLTALYNKLRQGNATSDDLKDLSQRAARFRLTYPEHRYAKTAKSLETWIANARGGHVQVVVVALQENCFGDNWKMKYQIKAYTGLSNSLEKSGERQVTKWVTVDDSLEIPWVPETRIEISLNVQDKRYLGQAQFTLAAEGVIQQESGAWREVAANGGDYKLWYRINRNGFDSLPAFP